MIYFHSCEKVDSDNFLPVLIVTGEDFLEILFFSDPARTLWPAVRLPADTSNEKINVTIGIGGSPLRREETPSGDLYGPFQLNIFCRMPRWNWSLSYWNCANKIRLSQVLVERVICHTDLSFWVAIS